MIDKWFISDINKIFEHNSIAVFIDVSKNAKFLLGCLNAEYCIHYTNTELEELHVKYLIEKNNSSTEKHLIYTQQPKKTLKYIREYCEVNGALEIIHLQDYLKNKIHKKLNLNINLSENDFLSAAKVSIGKDKSFWLDVCHKGAGEIFDLKKELPLFIGNPGEFDENEYDEQLRDTFYNKIQVKIIGGRNLRQTPDDLASSVVKKLFDDLLVGKCDSTLKSLYQTLLDSRSYINSLPEHIKRYKLPSKLDIWGVSVDHPFWAIDEKWLEFIGQRINDVNSIEPYFPKIIARSNSKEAKALNITIWSDVLILLQFNKKDISFLSSFDECVEFYTNHFYKLDTAIRNIYTVLLNKSNLLKPFQELYKDLVSIFLDKWFKYFDNYKETQTGIIQNIINNNKNQKIAIIVGDGVSYELACQISNEISSSYKFTDKVVIGGLPSETENNMSLIYRDDSKIEKFHNNREKYLSEQNSETIIEYIKLEHVSEQLRKSQVLICSHKDIDSMGEKMQQEALKFFNEDVSFIADKIKLLLQSSYSKVFLISDHGFVLTGLLSESDKISISLNGDNNSVAERYIRTKERQSEMSDNCLEIKQSFKDYNYLYLAKTINPFKTPGVYGFSHGGATPQELVTPLFCWEQENNLNLLSVNIENKEDLSSVTGDLYQLVIKTDDGIGDLASMERKVYLVFYSDNKQIRKSDFFNVKRNELVKKEYSFDEYTEIEVILLDALTNEQIDNALIKKNDDRDLGGLGGLG